MNNREDLEIVTCCFVCRTIECRHTLKFPWSLFSKRGTPDVDMYKVDRSEVTYGLVTSIRCFRTGVDINVLVHSSNLPGRLDCRKLAEGVRASDSLTLCHDTGGNPHYVNGSMAVSLSTAQVVRFTNSGWTLADSLYIED